ncbi:MAG TPA: NUDIX hydrolase [Candidatus Kapabacteria bacterium]|nr:NUDIX hydrolase [Candidatus Kapabacteria bacterium]
MKNWITIKESNATDLKIFESVWYLRKHPEQEKEGNFIVLKSPRWVNIIPITKNKEVVLIKQYRHGIDAVTLEVPGGLVQDDDTTQAGAERECLEETGFGSSDPSVWLGENLPNPAFLNNTCNSYVWSDCELIQKQKFDTHEDIEVLLVPLSEIKQYILDAKITHSLVLTAFFYFQLKYGL